MGGTTSLEHKTALCDGVPVDKYVYVWTVSNIQKYLSNGVGYKTQTSVLTLNSDETFRVVLYPNGFNERTNGYASLWLQKLSSNEKLLRFTCAIVGDDGNKVLKKTIKKQLGIESFIGWMTFFPRNILIEEDPSVLVNGNLILKCSVQMCNDDKLLGNPENEDSVIANSVLCGLSNNFMSLWADEAYCDFSIYVQETKFAVHKAILSARSPVFRVMLKSQLTNTDSITITDISEPIVKKMLRCIYSGEVGVLDFEAASELYYAADKYQIILLKSVCFNIITKKIRVDNVLSALLLSENHSDYELREICIQFVVKNAPEVHELPEWMEFLKSQPHLANVIFRRLAPKK
ncbi:hypothetical protein JTE90_023482 [Oedothorax gibbosus]|uniref:Speckle-type POZ protein n=1 Tax=Oedothorax gibbosus TaxID=931172 RepID=A0AAV6VPS0_9ARAC|nr:hypothetical protein JTE90_023482 [Oedothorax gibbosus]